MSADSSSKKGGKALRIDDEEVRIVMVGKTGAGKSATGNTILGFKGFESKFAGGSVTITCEKLRGLVAGRKVVVVDTPGLLDTRFTDETTLREIKQSICFAAPGPHVFFVVIKLGRFTAEEQKSVEMIQERFGPMSNVYTMIIFTNGDQLGAGTIEEFLKSSDELQELVSKCEHRYHVFNNKPENPSQVTTQVTELLEKIDKMVLKNGGSHYTNEMFQEAEKQIEEEKQIILKENEEKRRKEVEELKKTFMGVDLEKQLGMLEQRHEQEAREKAETSNKFLTFQLILGAITARGAAIGASSLSRLGPLGATAGTVVGGAIGSVAGLAVGAVCAVALDLDDSDHEDLRNVVFEAGHSILDYF